MIEQMFLLFIDDIDKIYKIVTVEAGNDKYVDLAIFFATKVVCLIVLDKV